VAFDDGAVRHAISAVAMVAIMLRSSIAVVGARFIMFACMSSSLSHSKNNTSHQLSAQSLVIAAVSSTLVFSFISVVAVELLGCSSSMVLHVYGIAFSWALPRALPRTTLASPSGETPSQIHRRKDVTHGCLSIVCESPRALLSPTLSPPPPPQLLAFVISTPTLKCPLSSIAHTRLCSPQCLCCMHASHHRPQHSFCSCSSAVAAICCRIFILLSKDISSPL
jgi:hypothetical protein